MCFMPPIITGREYCKIRSILDTDSVLNWTWIPELTGQWIRFRVDSKSSFK